MHSLPPLDVKSDLESPTASPTVLSSHSEVYETDKLVPSKMSDSSSLSVTGSVTAMTVVAGPIPYVARLLTIPVLVPVSGVVSGLIDVAVASLSGKEVLSM